jgi:hypothetical protein
LFVCLFLKNFFLPYYSISSKSLWLHMNHTVILLKGGLWLSNPEELPVLISKANAKTAGLTTTPQVLGV